MKKIFLLILTAAFTVISVTSVCALSINIDPPSIQLDVAPGSSVSEKIHIKNLDENPVSIKVYAEDWKFKADGTKEFLPAGTVDRSCARWIHISNDSIMLKGGEEGNVTFTLTVPPNDVDGGHWAVIFFEAEMARDKKASGMGVILAGRIGTLIYQNTTGKTEKNGTITDLVASPPDENKPLYFKYTFKNEGNGLLFAGGNILIVDKDGKSYGKTDVPRLVVLPYANAVGRAQWLGVLPSGQFNAILTLDFGGAGPAATERPILVSKSINIGKIRTVYLGKKSGTNIFVDVRNSGNLNAEISGQCEIVDPSGSSLGSALLKSMVFGPGSAKTMSTNFAPPLIPGKYTVKVSLNYGNETKTAENTFLVR